MVVLVDFVIQVINRGFLKIISIIILGEFYMLYFNFETFILDDLQKTRDGLKI